MIYFIVIIDLIYVRINAILLGQLRCPSRYAT